MSDGSLSDEIVTAALIVIGDEILSGRTKDKNIGYVADHCSAIGIQLKEVRIIGDEAAEIAAAVNALRAKYSYVFTTGGIGPTHDDITADSIAKAFGVAIDIDQRALDVMLPHFKARGVEITPARLRMARIPDGADLVDNPVSKAPGFMLDNVITMAGIPSIMQVMLDAVTPRLKKGRMMHAEAIDLDYPEGTVAELLGSHQQAYPEVAMGSYPTIKNNRPCTQLVLRSVDAERLQRATQELRKLLSDQSLL